MAVGICHTLPKAKELGQVHITRASGEGVCGDLSQNQSRLEGNMDSCASGGSLITSWQKAWLAKRGQTTNWFLHGCKRQNPELEAISKNSPSDKKKKISLSSSSSLPDK